MPLVFSGMADLVVQVQHFIVNKVEDKVKYNLCQTFFFILLDRIEGDS